MIRSGDRRISARRNPLRKRARRRWPDRRSSAAADPRHRSCPRPRRADGPTAHALRRRTGAIELPGEILLSELLEELTDLTGGAAPQIGGVVARATRTSEDVADCALVDADRLDLDAVEQPAVVEACPRLFPVREAGPER